MKKNRVYFGILILALLAVIGWASFGMLNVGKEEKMYSVSVIVNDSNNDRWIAMREGLEQSASDNKIELNIVSTGEISDIEEEQSLIDRELKNGADGIIVQMISSDEEASKVVENIASKAEIILMDTDVLPEDVYKTVISDNEAIGEAIGQELQNDRGEDLEGKKIGILSGNQNQLSMSQRLTGFLDSISDSGAQIEWTLDAEGTGLDARLAKAQQEDAVDIVVALGNDEIETAVDYLETKAGMTQSYLLYGEGVSEKAVYYLDKGIIQSLVVPNEFNMGYQSVSVIAKQLQYKVSMEVNTPIDFLLINKDNLYEEDNQKILFPIVQ